MKAKDLKSDYTFAQRRPYIEDHVFYVPQYYSDYDQFLFPSFAEIFGNNHPVCIEYCSGNGDWIADQAVQEPGKNWIAVEKRFDRVRKIWAKMKNRQLDNLLIVCGEAFTFTRHYISAASVEGTFIHFPDPWPKGRHAKHRLIQNRFLDELARVLKPGKGSTFVTDDFTYLHAILLHFKKDVRFSPALPEPHYVTEQETYGSSWFENLWREKGKNIHYTQFLKR